MLLAAGSDCSEPLAFDFSFEKLLFQIIISPAKIKSRQKARNRTLMDSLELLKARGILQEENDLFKAEPLSLAVLRYYANSIAHWGATNC